MEGRMVWQWRLVKVVVDVDALRLFKVGGKFVGIAVADVGVVVHEQKRDRVFVWELQWS